jgi:DNA-binding winged helix-turn-helix (wHTH) protein/tetratricopeptide (TPR) repeat protein
MTAYEFGRFRLDVERLLLYCDGAAMALGPKVVKTLLALVERPGEIHSKKTLLDRVWPEGYVEEANLVQNIYVLRKVMRGCGYPAAIETVSRRGYRFTLNARACDAAGSKQIRPILWRLWKPVAAAIAGTAVLIGAAWAYGLSHQTEPAALSAASRLDQIGNFFLAMRTPRGVRRSIVYYTRAITETPSNAQGYASRAKAFAVMADNGLTPPTAQVSRARARADAARALTLDPRSGRAYAALGLMAIDTRRFGDALRDLRTATQFAPNDADAHEWYGIALLAQDRIGRAEAELETAERLSPLSIAATDWLSTASYLDHRYAEAIEVANDGLSIAPQRNSLWITLGLAQEAQGSYADAVRSFTRYGRSCAKCKSESAVLLAGMYTQMHRPTQARAELAIARADLRDVRSTDLALALAEMSRSSTPPPVRLSSLDRIILANDPRFGRLPSRIRMKLLDNQG